MDEALLPKISAGIYRHYKGPLYLVLGYGHDANIENRNVVIYIGLELDEAHTGPRLAVRTVEDFLEKVCGSDTCSQYGMVLRVNHWGQCTQCQGPGANRFMYIGPSYTSDM